MNSNWSGRDDAARHDGSNSTSAPEQNVPIAWLPLTARGVAAFARAPLRRLLLVQLVVALVAAGTLVWFLYRCWFPTVGKAIQALPPHGALHSGTLEWSEASPACLAEGRFLAFVVDLDHTGQARFPAHVQIEFGRQDLEVYSLLGFAQRAYPRDQTLPFNRTDLVPWWGAWAPAFLAMAGGLAAGAAMVGWACLATLYCLPAWLFGFFANRDCGLAGAWRMAGAALMPGALMLCAIVLLYGWGTLDLVRLAVGWAAHLVASWVYLFIGLVSLPRHPAAPPKTNPFV